MFLKGNIDAGNKVSRAGNRVLVLHFDKDRSFDKQRGSDKSK